MFDGVLDMLSGRYPSDEFAELRPRVTWDRVAGTVRAREGAKRVAVTNGGTIPDRGLYGVFLSAPTRAARVGELDEEMVFERRVGETFVLGASSWRIEEITHDRVLVSPAPGEPGQDAVLEGRSARAGRSSSGIGLMRRGGAATAPSFEHDLDALRRENLSKYLDDQEAATGVIPPTARSSSSASATSSATGASACCRRSAAASTRRGRWPSSGACARRSGIDVETLWADDGIAIRFPDSDTPPPIDAARDPARRPRRPPASTGSPRARSSRPSSARTPPARSSSRAAAPGSERRSGSSGEGARPPAGRAEVRLVPGAARDVSRGAVATSSTCRR